MTDQSPTPVLKAITDEGDGRFRIELEGIDRLEKFEETAVSNLIIDLMDRASIGSIAGQVSENLHARVAGWATLEKLSVDEVEVEDFRLSGTQRALVLDVNVDRVQTAAVDLKHWAKVGDLSLEEANRASFKLSGFSEVDSVVVGRSQNFSLVSRNSSNLGALDIKDVSDLSLSLQHRAMVEEIVVGEVEQANFFIQGQSKIEDLNIEKYSDVDLQLNDSARVEEINLGLTGEDVSMPPEQAGGSGSDPVQSSKLSVSLEDNSEIGTLKSGGAGDKQLHLSDNAAISNVSVVEKSTIDAKLLDLSSVNNFVISSADRINFNLSGRSSIKALLVGEIDNHSMLRLRDNAEIGLVEVLDASSLGVRLQNQSTLENLLLGGGEQFSVIARHSSRISNLKIYNTDDTQIRFSESVLVKNVELVGTADENGETSGESRVEIDDQSEVWGLSASKLKDVVVVVADEATLDDFSAFAVSSLKFEGPNKSVVVGTIDVKNGDYRTGDGVDIIGIEVGVHSSSKTIINSGNGNDAVVLKLALDDEENGSSEKNGETRHVAKVNLGSGDDSIHMLMSKGVGATEVFVDGGDGDDSLTLSLESGSYEKLIVSFADYDESASSESHLFEISSGSNSWRIQDMEQVYLDMAGELYDLTQSILDAKEAGFGALSIEEIVAPQEEDGASGNGSPASTPAEDTPKNSSDEDTSTPDSSPGAGYEGEATGDLRSEAISVEGEASFSSNANNTIDWVNFLLRGSIVGESVASLDSTTRAGVSGEVNSGLFSGRAETSAEYALAVKAGLEARTGGALVPEALGIDLTSTLVAQLRAGTSGKLDFEGGAMEAEADGLLYAGAWADLGGSYDFGKDGAKASGRVALKAGAGAIAGAGVGGETDFGDMHGKAYLGVKSPGAVGFSGGGGASVDSSGMIAADLDLKIAFLVSGGRINVEFGVDVPELYGDTKTVVADTANAVGSTFENAANDIWDLTPFCFAAGTMIALMDGTLRAIEDIRIGDRLKGGGRVYMTGAFLAADLFNLNGVMVTGSHLVKSAAGWVEVKDHNEAVPAVITSRKVYNLASTCNRIETGGMIFADYAEISGPLVEDLMVRLAEWDKAAQAA